jgi:hypothetical protein
MSQRLPPLKITEVRVIVTCPDRNYALVKVLTSEPVPISQPPVDTTAACMIGRSSIGGCTPFGGALECGSLLPL